MAGSLAPRLLASDLLRDESCCQRRNAPYMVAVTNQYFASFCLCVFVEGGSINGLEWPKDRRPTRPLYGTAHSATKEVGSLPYSHSIVFHRIEKSCV